MKTAWTLAAALALLAAGGCERPEEPEPTSEYDTEIDGPPPVYAPSGDPNLLADQKKLAREAAAKARAALPTPLGPSAGPARAKLPPGTNPVQSARQALQGAASALQAGRQQQATDLMGPELARLLQQLTSLPQVMMKMKAVEQLVRQKFGDAAAAKVQTLGQLGGQPGPTGPAPQPAFDEMAKQFGQEKMLGEFLDMAGAKFEAEGDDVVVSQADGSQFRMVYTAQGWKIEMEPLMRDLLTAATEVFASMSKAADALTAGINDGSITQANFDARVQAVGEQHLKAATEKFLKAMMAGLQKAMAGPAAPGPPGPTTPGPPGPTTAPGPSLPEF